MTRGYKTGGKTKGTKNKPKPEILPPDQALAKIEQVRAAALLLPSEIRLPKAVMLDAMVRFENIGLGFLEQSEKKMARWPDKAAELAREGHRFIIAAVECATKVAPYIHARLLAIESRGDMVDQVAPFVVRAPAVIADSTVWQAQTGAGLVNLDELTPAPGKVEGLPAASPSPPRPLPEILPPIDQMEPEARKPLPPNFMPAGNPTIQPSGTESWLADVAKDRKIA